MSQRRHGVEGLYCFASEKRAKTPNISPQIHDERVM
jgi:hypothetical protein